jgi:hypothetical protein
MAEDPETTAGDDEGDEEGDDESVIDALRDMPVGTNDPNIIGDAGPLDVPPGSDPHRAEELEE